MKTITDTNWHWEKLVDVAEIIMGQSPPGDTYHNFPEGMPFFQGKTDFGEIHPITRMYCSAPTRIAEPNDILISVRAPVGPTNIAQVPCCIGRGLAAIRPQPKLEAFYLLYFLRFYETKLANSGRGSTFDAIGRDDLENIIIPLPPLDEQRRIAAILQRADRLRRLRRFSRQLSDTFLQSVFLQMFGDFRINPSRYKIQRLDDLADIVSGITKGQKYGSRETFEIPYLRVANVQAGYLDLSEIKTISVPFSEAEPLWLQVGDVLLTEGGDFDKLGRGAVWNGEILKCIHQNHIFRTRLNQKYILPHYFEIFLLSEFARQYFLGASKQTTNLASINMTQLKNLPVPLPNMREQQKFVDVYNQHYTIKKTQDESSRQSEHLFQTLLARAFSEI